LKSLQEWWQSFEQKMLAQAKAGESSSEAAETSDEKMKEESSEKPKDACYYWYNASLEHWKGETRLLYNAQPKWTHLLLFIDLTRCPCYIGWSSWWILMHIR